MNGGFRTIKRHPIIYMLKALRVVIINGREWLICCFAACLIVLFFVYRSSQDNRVTI